MNRTQRQRGVVAALSILVLACAAHAQLSSDAPGIKSDREMRSDRERGGWTPEEAARRLDDTDPTVRLEAVKRSLKRTAPSRKST